MKSKKGDKKYGQRGSEGHNWINVNSQVYIGNKEVRKMILIRNREILKLWRVVERLTKENIKLRERLKVRR